MGVPGLWKELQCHGNDTALAKLSQLVNDDGGISTSIPRRSLRLGVDISSWLFHAQKCVGGNNPQLRLLFFRLCKLLSIPDIIPVFVFDGPLRPKEKRGKLTQTYREGTFVSELKTLIVAFGFVVHEAIGEAEAELARLNHKRAIDAIMSDDVDCFIFGATLVIRNWGQELSGSKARTTYNDGTSSDSSPSPSSNEGDAAPSASQGVQTHLSANDRLALGNNLITYYRACNLDQHGLTTEGLILVAILSGGDYDVQGLPRCGVKIATALAKAGYGESLITGLKKHCKSPRKTSTSSLLTNKMPAPPQPLTTWSNFLTDWRASVRHELSTDENGYLGKRFKKLAESSGFTELLSTKASLSVLGSYVWPLTREEIPVFQQGKVDLCQIGHLCQHLFHWTAGNTLETFRNNLWQGCAIKEFTGGDIANLSRSARLPRDDVKKGSSTNGNIADYFISKTKARTSIKDIPSPTSSFVLSVAGERQSRLTGHVRELRVVCDVKAYADLATKGLDFDLVFQRAREGYDLPSSQGTPAASPRKRKPFKDPNKEVRMWIAKDVVLRDADCQRKVEEYHEKQKSKGYSSKSKSTNETGQERIDAFFVGKKTTPIAIGKSISPSKRRAPLGTSSLSLLSSAPPSRSSSPCQQVSRRCNLKGRADQITSSDKAKSIAVSNRNTPREEVCPAFEYAKWNSHILDDDDTDDDKGKHDEAYDFDTSSSLPSLGTLLASRKGTAAATSTAGDDSIKIVKVTHSPTKKRNKNTLATAIEVFDDSDEE